MRRARHAAFATFSECSMRFGRQTRKIPHSLRPCRETRPCDLSLPTNPLKPTASSLPIYDKTTDPFHRGKVAWSFTKQTKTEKQSSEKHCHLPITFRRLFRQDFFSVRGPALSFLKSPLSFLFLLFLAGQFFSPPFAFIHSGTFGQHSLLIPQEVYHEKRKIFNLVRPKGLFLRFFSSYSCHLVNPSGVCLTLR